MIPMKLAVVAELVVGTLLGECTKGACDFCELPTGDHMRNLGRSSAIHYRSAGVTYMLANP
jgi:hypothetical protein